MARRQRRIMIVCATLSRTAAVRRQHDSDVSVDADAKPKAAVPGIWIVCRIAPGGVNTRYDLRGESSQESGIIGERQIG
jgi:hypothetical protein